MTIRNLELRFNQTFPVTRTNSNSTRHMCRKIQHCPSIWRPIEGNYKI